MEAFHLVRQISFILGFSNDLGFVFLQLKELFILGCDDMVEFVLRDINIRHIIGSAIQEMR